MPYNNHVNNNDSFISNDSGEQSGQKWHALQNLILNDENKNQKKSVLDLIMKQRKLVRYQKE